MSFNVVIVSICSNCNCQHITKDEATNLLKNASFNEKIGSLWNIIFSLSWFDDKEIEKR